MLTLTELKRLHDKMYTHNQVTRERAADDMLFYHITQWDDNLLGQAQLQYRGQFDVLRKAGRQIMADLRANPVQVDFEPKDEGRDDGADLLDGIYRADDRVNTSREAYDNASSEAVVCGYGAWELYTEYETNRAGNENQVIRRRPVYEANNNCYWDTNSKRLDKSDANYADILVAYSQEGYRDLVKDLTGEDIGSDYVMDSFKTPEESYAFPWAAGDNTYIYVATFYHREKTKDIILTLEDPLGMPLVLRQSDLEDVMDDLIDEGYKIVDEKEIKRWKVTKYIASGERILKTYDVPGESIPLIPTYGERAFVEGEEHYEGVTRLAKDPQRLRNFQLSYLADIVSRSPRPKPIFTPEQVQGFEFMFEDTGADNHYPYLLNNSKDANGAALPIGPVAVMPESQAPTSLIQSIALSREAVSDVADPGVPQDIADTDLSGKAVIALQARLDQQSLVYQQNFKHAKRRDAEIYAQMAAEVYDAPRKVTLVLPDGTTKKVQVMETIQDKETGEMKVLNDVTNMEFDVYAEIGPNYQTKKEQTIEQLGAMGTAVAQTDPNMQKMLILKQLTLIDGVNMDDVRDYARKQLILSGFMEPETDEEILMLQQNQQNQQPDPNMLIGQAEIMKGQAQLMKEQRETAKDAATIENNQAKTQIDAFNAETDRIETQIKAKKAGADINYTNIKAFNERLEGAAKATAAFRATATPGLRLVQ